MSKKEGFWAVAYLCFVISYIVGIAVVIYVAAHFIQKYW